MAAVVAAVAAASSSSSCVLFFIVCSFAKYFRFAFFASHFFPRLVCVTFGRASVCPCVCEWMCVPYAQSTLSNMIDRDPRVTNSYVCIWCKTWLRRREAKRKGSANDIVCHSSRWGTREINEEPESVRERERKRKKSVTNRHCPMNTNGPFSCFA